MPSSGTCFRYEYDLELQAENPQQELKKFQRGARKLRAPQPLEDIVGRPGGENRSENRFRNPIKLLRQYRNRKSCCILVVSTRRTRLTLPQCVNKTSRVIYVLFFFRGLFFKAFVLLGGSRDSAINQAKFAAMSGKSAICNCNRETQDRRRIHIDRTFTFAAKKERKARMSIFSQGECGFERNFHASLHTIKGTLEHVIYGTHFLD